MKKLIVTRADNRIKNMTDMTHPIMRMYADRCGADFKILNHFDAHYPHPYHYRIMKVGDLLEDYDMVLSLDSDIVIHPECENLFDPPQHYILSVYEDKGTRKDHRRNLIKNVQERYGDVEWSEGYINTGVFRVSKEHKDIFKSMKDGTYWDGFGFDDVHLGWHIRNLGYEMLPLDQKYNFMSMFSEPWNDNADRFDSRIIHYAGQGIFDRNVVRTRNEQIANDIPHWWGNV